MLQMIVTICTMVLGWISGYSFGRLRHHQFVAPGYRRIRDRIELDQLFPSFEDWCDAFPAGRDKTRKERNEDN